MLLHIPYTLPKELIIRVISLETNYQRQRHGFIRIIIILPKSSSIIYIWFNICPVQCLVHYTSCSIYVLLGIHYCRMNAMKATRCGLLKEVRKKLFCKEKTESRNVCFCETTWPSHD